MRVKPEGKEEKRISKCRKREKLKKIVLKFLKYENKNIEENKKQNFKIIENIYLNKNKN